MASSAVRCALAGSLTLVVLALSADGVSAQGRAVALEAGAGYAAFVDNDAIDHSTWAAAAWLGLSRRVWIGPELVYMIGPGEDRDVLATLSLRLDLRGAGITPYLVAGGGLYQHRDRFFQQTFTSREGGFTAGVGVRIPIGNDGWYVAPEARGGWEPHAGAGVRVGRVWR